MPIAMYHLFTLDEATRLLPFVDEHVAAMQVAVSELATLRARLAKLEPNSIDARNLAQEIGFVLREAHQHQLDLERKGIRITDLDSGSVDFPSRLQGEVVCLTWERGQSSITHYHRLTGTGDVRPLPAGPDLRGHSVTPNERTSSTLGA